MAKGHIRKKKRELRPNWGMLALITAVFVLILSLAVGLATCRRDEGPEADALWDGSWYRDDLGRLGEDKALVRGMEAFEKKTGIKPFLILLGDLDPEELDAYARGQFEALFGGGDHLLVIYDEWEEDIYFLSARAAEGSPLEEADLSRLLDALENAYDDPGNGSYAEAFGAGFAAGGELLAEKTQRSGGGWWLWLLGLILLALGGALALRSRKKARVSSRRRRDEGSRSHYPNHILRTA